MVSQPRIPVISVGWGFSRAVDGLDTNDNNTDFVLVCITPGQANTDQISDCEVIIETPGVGDLVITELMPNPNAVPDSVGEWFEMINVSASSMSLTGCTIADAALQHIIAGELTVGAGERVLFAKSADSVINGGMSAVDYVYPDIALGNMGDSMSLTCESVEVDIVVYDSSWPHASGVSMQLDPGAQDSVSNNSSSAWCSGASAYGDGDLGTPGEANGDCAPP